MLLILVLFLLFVIWLIVWKVDNSRGISQVTVEAAQEMIKSPGTVILDVRSPQEFMEGHLEGARLVPAVELRERIDELASLKDRQILVYCHAGSRSSAAGRLLKKNGFARIANLKGGIVAWKGKGFALVRG